jgi:hypothetical protein
MLRRVALVRTDVSEELSASIITLMMEALSSYETSEQVPHDVTSQKTAFLRSEPH